MTEWEELSKQPAEWAEVLEHLGVSDAEFDAQLRERLALGYYHLDTGSSEVRESLIHGDGSFATVFTHGGRVAEVVQFQGQLTRAGAHVNHSHRPNCELVHNAQGYVYLRALRDISPDEELTHDYRKPTWSAK